MGNQFFIRYQDLFWRPKGVGYTSDAMQAGLYTEVEIQERFGHTQSDKRNSRGDYPCEVGWYLRNNNVTLAELDEMRKRLDYFGSLLGEKSTQDNDGHAPGCVFLAKWICELRCPIRLSYLSKGFDLSKGG